MSELKSCPFCNANDLGICDNEDSEVFAYCDSCRSTGIPVDISDIENYDDNADCFTQSDEVNQRIYDASWNTRAPQASIDMILYCPNCGEQHIDKEAPWRRTYACYHIGPTCFYCEGLNEGRWANPPHRSHLCNSCGCIWRPADVATNGVADIKTEGKTDTWVTPAEVSAQPAAHDGLKPINATPPDREFIGRIANLEHMQPAAVPSEQQLINALREMISAQKINPSCQAGVVDKCQCIACASFRLGEIEHIVKSPAIVSGFVPDFEVEWAKKKKMGYRYGSDALEQVRLGFEMAVKAIEVKK